MTRPRVDDRRRYGATRTCEHLYVTIVDVTVCSHRLPHKHYPLPCSSQDVRALCRCGARLIAFGWNDFDKRRWSRLGGVLTEYGKWRLQTAVAPSAERQVAQEQGIDEATDNPWREIDR